MKEVFAALLEQLRAGNDALLATLVVQTGSGPRGLGAQMVLTRAGRVAGTIGGGTGEQEMTRFGRTLLDDRRSAVHTCGRHGERPGASCFGEITVHFQAVPAGDAAWTALAGTLLERIGQRRGGWLVLRLNGGAPALLDGEGRCVLGQAPEGAAALCRP